MEVYKSKNLTITYSEEGSMLTMDWAPAVEDVSEEEYKDEMMQYIKSIETYTPDAVLIDATKANYAINPDLQIWINKNIIARAMKAGLKKTAIVLPDDLITRLGVEQTFDEDKNPVIKRQYFGNVKEAKEWLLS